MTDIREEKLKPCPFCGHLPDLSSDDLCYPSNREKTAYSLNCVEHEGGCGAQVLGDSEDDCFSRWQHRSDQTEIDALRAENERLKAGLRDAAQSLNAISEINKNHSLNDLTDAKSYAKSRAKIAFGALAEALQEQNK